jgi:hypothetical protein
VLSGFPTPGGDFRESDGDAPLCPLGRVVPRQRRHLGMARRNDTRLRAVGEREPRGGGDGVEHGRSVRRDARGGMEVGKGQPAKVERAPRRRLGRRCRQITLQRSCRRQRLELADAQLAVVSRLSPPTSWSNSFRPRVLGHV